VEDIAEWMCDMQQTLDGVTQWAEPPALMQELSPAFSQELSKTRWQHVAVDDGVATWEDVVSHN